MARLALLDAGEGTAIALRAAATSHVVAASGRDAVPADADLVVIEVRDGATLAAADLGASTCPVLVLATKRASIDEASFGDRPLHIFRKPLDPASLRVEVRRLLDAVAPVTGPMAESPWLKTPLVSREAESTLSAARRIGGTAWIVGEAGTGTDRVAAALASTWARGGAVVAWQEDEPLASALARAGDGAVLWAPGIDERPLGEQRALERFLAGNPARRVVATSGDDPAEAVACGSLARGLHDSLGRLALRLAPLRERPRDIASLASSIGADVAESLGAPSFSLAEDAASVLAAYPWPGNYVELEAVVTRSVIAAAAGSTPLELTAAGLRFASGLWPREADASAAAATVSRRAVVLPMEAARIARPSETASVSAVQVPAAAGDAAGVEALLAAFAHDIRNPMSTIKTFAGLQAATAGDDQKELARLAVEACERVDEQLEFLQRYSELAEGRPSRVDLVDVLGEAVDGGGDADAMAVAARSSLWTRIDADLARFVADALVAECRSRRTASGAAAETAVADLASGGSAIEIRIPIGAAAVDRLGKWVDGRSLPWRLALAREAARRAGADIEMTTGDGEMRLRWQAGAAEERSHDDEAGSPDRRRRSRSS